MVPIDDRERTHFTVRCPNPNCLALSGELAFSRDELMGLLTRTVRLYCGICDYRWDADLDLRSKIPGMLKQLDRKPAGKGE